MDFDFLKQKRILLVDDEQELLDMVSSIFADEGFCDLKTAKTVKEDLLIFLHFRPYKNGQTVVQHLSHSNQKQYLKK